MTEIYKSTISYLSWEAYTDKPEWILELFEQELLFEDENGKILIKADGDPVVLNSGNKVVFELDTNKILYCEKEDLKKLFEKVDTEPKIVYIEKTFGLIKTNVALIYGTMLSAFILSPERNIIYTGLATVSSILMLYIFLDLRTIYDCIYEFAEDVEDE